MPDKEEYSPIEEKLEAIPGANAFIDKLKNYKLVGGVVVAALAALTGLLALVNGETEAEVVETTTTTVTAPEKPGPTISLDESWAGVEAAVENYCVIAGESEIGADDATEAFNELRDAVNVYESVPNKTVESPEAPNVEDPKSFLCESGS